MCGVLVCPGAITGLKVPPYDDEAALAPLMREHASSVLRARASVARAENKYLRATLDPTPSLETTWNTISIGRTNSAALPKRLARVPSYSAALAQLVEIGKRAPRQAARSHNLKRSRAKAPAVPRNRFFSLLEIVGRIAGDRKRKAVLQEEIRDGMELLELYRTRASRGGITPLDVDVAEVEQARLSALREADEPGLKQARSECPALLALSCPPSPTSERERAFLLRVESVGDKSDVSLDEAFRGGPDVHALRAAIAPAKQRAL